MSLLAQLVARVRGRSVPMYPEASDTEIAAMNVRGDLSIAQGLPELTELVRMGGSYHALSAAQANLSAAPTTVAGYSLYNGEPDDGQSYAIDSFGCVEIVADTTQQNSLALFALMGIGVQTAPSDDAIRGSMSGRKYGGLAKTAAGVTVVNDVWTPHGPATPGATAFAGVPWRVTEFQARGLYFVRPKGMFSIAAVKVAATAASIRYFIRWHEVQVPYKT